MTSNYSILALNFLMAGSSEAQLLAGVSDSQATYCPSTPQKTVKTVAMRIPLYFATKQSGANEGPSRCRYSKMPLWRSGDAGSSLNSTFIGSEMLVCTQDWRFPLCVASGGPGTRLEWGTPGLSCSQSPLDAPCSQ
jgi:hypothetical protein